MDDERARPAHHLRRLRTARFRVAASALCAAIVVSVALACVTVAGSFASTPDPQKAASALVAKLEAQSKTAHVSTFAASKVVSRNGNLWLAFGDSPAGVPFLGGGAEPTRVRIYRWSAGTWNVSGTVSGELGPSQWIYPAALTGSADPDFAIEGCGAGDTNCLSVVSDVGGRWHAVPFEYGYGTSLEVNGVPEGKYNAPAGRLVETEVDACSCAGGPSTSMDESYQNGAFRPTFGPGPPPDCSAAKLTGVADFWEVQVLRFDRVDCGGGWALAVGTGAGFSGPVVGLFDRGYRQNGWQVLTLDNGTALPAAPAIYDLPLALLARLALGLGPPLAPDIAAAQLIAKLQSRYNFYWPEQEGIVLAAGTDWLVAPLPAGHPHNGYSAQPTSAVIYRWNGTSWATAGRVARLPASMDIEWYGGWFIAAPTDNPATIAFQLAGSQPGASNDVITNQGGTWHIAPSG